MHVLIAGGGVAGPVAALALQRAGIDATIVEARPEPDGDVGSYLTVAPNGLDALANVGALEPVVAASFPTRHNVLWNHAGRRLGQLRVGAPLPDGTVARTLKRARLARLLRDEAVGRGIPVVTGRRLRDATVDDGGRVLARFDDGGTEVADLLIGADGVHSRTRRIIDPAAPRPRYVGLTNFGGVTHDVDVGAIPEAWHLVFGRQAFFGYHPTPTGDVVWFANVPREAIDRAERDATTEQAWREHLMGRFARDRSPAADLIADGRLELAADNTHDLEHVPTWHRGPMVVIGDAAHAPAPTSGQGASLAIEDGVVLAKALRDVADLPAALAAYERERRSRVEEIVAYGARGSSDKTPQGPARVVRDLVLRVVFRHLVTDRSLAPMFDHRIVWDEPMTAATDVPRGTPDRTTSATTPR